jgi:DNA excision repair protein ERCC-3
VGLETATVLTVLNRLSKTQLPAEIESFVRECTQNYGKVKLVLQKNRFFLESAHPEVLRTLLADDIIQRARMVDGVPGGAAPDAAGVSAPFSISRAPVEAAAAALAAAAAGDATGADASADAGAAAAGGDDLDRELHSFEIDPAQVEHVKQRCLPGGLNYPTLEEYDFRADSVNPDVPGLELKPATQIRPYQDKSLSKMFGNGKKEKNVFSARACGR